MKPRRRAALVLATVVAARGAEAACHSTCTQQLVACKQTCSAGGKARRDCRAACAERSTCTAPGARIGTLAYVVTECRTDALGTMLSGGNKLVVRRGNCDPVAVKEIAIPTPVPDPLGLCRLYGQARAGPASMVVGPFQRLAVLPDGSGVIFELTDEYAVYPLENVPLGPLEKGIFFVRADGSGLRRLGDASRVRNFQVVPDPTSPLGVTFIIWEQFFALSPDSRKIAYNDLGPGRDGRDAEQVLVLDLASGKRTQLTPLPGVPDTGLPNCCASFTGPGEILFYDGSTDTVYTVKLDGTVLTAFRPPGLAGGGHIIQRFGTVGSSGRETAFIGIVSGMPANPTAGNDRVWEVFFINGKDELQLTNFGRADTTWVELSAQRVFFIASTNRLGKNPGENCQAFSISTLGSDLRQITRFRDEGRRSIGCADFLSACAISGIAPDPKTRALMVGASCDPVGTNPYGFQVFAVGPDGSGIRQLTSTRGMVVDPDGTVHVEMIAQWAYSAGRR